MKVVAVNNIKLCYEVFGSSSNPALLLIMGNSAQGMMWPDDFCQKLAAEERFVIRFDNRDTGLSSCFDFNKKPYDLFDMANDAIGLLAVLNIPKAHIVGLSMGGSIAQLLAIYHKDKVLSITSMMSSPDLSVKNDAFSGKDTSKAVLPPPDNEFVQAVIQLNSVKADTRAGKIKQIVENWRLANGKLAAFDEDYWLDLIEAAMTREEANDEAKHLQFANHSNHSKAQMATKEPNLETLKLITVPTLVIHGTEDPIFPPAHARAVSEVVPDAEILLIEKMGHALNPVFFDRIIDTIVEHTAEKAVYIQHKM